MKILIAGASGATGRLLVEELLKRNHQVSVFVRSIPNFPEHLKNYENLTIINKNVLDLSVEETATYASGCDAVASCLGHNINLKGIFGKPRKLVTESVQKLCQAIKANDAGKPTKFVLMNTIANSNRDLNEPASIGKKIIIGLVRLLVPPQADNEKAADYLRVQVGQNSNDIEWVAVRPDTLIDEEKVSAYEVYASPTKASIINDDKTSRINVAHFMADLITERNTWNEWKGQMPVIYNIESSD